MLAHAASAVKACLTNLALRVKIQAMDPQATLKLFLQAIEDGHLDEAEEHAFNYNTWVSRGGFKAKLDGADVLSLSTRTIYTSNGRVPTKK